MSEPARRKVVTVTINRITYGGTYFVQNFMVHVLSSFGAKAAPLGGARPKDVARLLLLELVRAELNA